LQPAAVFDSTFHVLSAINDPNDYAGPGSGYRLEGDRWKEIQNIPFVKSPYDVIDDCIGKPCPNLAELEDFRPGQRDEIVVAVSPAFGTALSRTIGGLYHEDVLAAILTGIAREGLIGRIMKVYQTSDLGRLSHIAARLSGSGIAIGLQSRGTAIIQKRGLQPLNNLELFPQSPSLTLKHYEAIGSNAAQYALGRQPKPVGVKVDNTARLRLIVKTALLHRRETELVKDQPPQEIRFNWEPDL
jgi:hypothetical protein